MCVTCRRWHNLVQTRLQRGPLALHWDSARPVPLPFDSLDDYDEYQMSTGHHGYVSGCAFAPDGATFVTASNDHTACTLKFSLKNIHLKNAVSAGTSNALAFLANCITHTSLFC